MRERRYTRWTSDDARLPGQFAIMAGTADRAL